MTNLRVVDLRGNALRALPDDIGCLVRLETLDVGENALETLPKSLGNCRRSWTRRSANACARRRVSTRSGIVSIWRAWTRRRIVRCAARFLCRGGV